eukprot:11196092-Alexandrium_andersonii.AAC.1
MVLTRASSQVCPWSASWSRAPTARRPRSSGEGPAQGLRSGGRQGRGPAEVELFVTSTLAYQRPPLPR